jgi:hypothetical protein
MNARQFVSWWYWLMKLSKYICLMEMKIVDWGFEVVLFVFFFGVVMRRECCVVVGKNRYAIRV